MRNFSLAVALLALPLGGMMTTKVQAAPPSAPKATAKTTLAKPRVATARFGYRPPYGGGWRRPPYRGGWRYPYYPRKFR